VVLNIIVGHSVDNPMAIPMLIIMRRENRRVESMARWRCFAVNERRLVIFSRPAFRPLSSHVAHSFPNIYIPLATKSQPTMPQDLLIPTTGKGTGNRYIRQQREHGLQESWVIVPIDKCQLPVSGSAGHNANCGLYCQSPGNTAIRRVVLPPIAGLYSQLWAIVPIVGLYCQLLGHSANC
jgi:hypothetical protein